MMRTAPKSLGYFLLFLCALIYLVALVGAATRLTQSGLSIMTWDIFKLFWRWPNADQIDFYYQIYVNEVPQYLVTGYSRSEFVLPVFWEWFHRNIGKTVGLVAILGTVWFFARRQVPRHLTLPILSMAPLLGLQGVIGIFMVWSGFNTVDDVSHYRLALHLGTAFFACGLFFYTALRVLRPQVEWDIPLHPWAWALAALILTLLFGAFTAGLNAADVSNSWPGFYPGQFAPNGLCDGSDPWRLSCWFNSKRGVHFLHRNMAMIAAALVIFACFRTWMLTNAGGARTLAALGLLTVSVQFALGVWLVVTGGLIANPTVAKQTVAVLHQIGALTLLLIALAALYGRQRA